MTLIDSAIAPKAVLGINRENMAYTRVPKENERVPLDGIHLWSIDIARDNWRIIYNLSNPLLRAALDAGSSGRPYLHQYPHQDNIYHRWYFEHVDKYYYQLLNIGARDDRKWALDNGDGVDLKLSPEVNPNNSQQLWRLTKIGDFWAISSKYYD